MSLVTITEAVKQDIIKSMGSGRVSFHNPIDLLGDASAFHYKSAIRATIKEKKTGAVVILLTPQANTEIEKTASVIADAQDWFDTPIYPIFMGEASVGNSHTFFEERKIASFSSYDFLPIAIAKIITYKNWLEDHMEQLPTTELKQAPVITLPAGKKLLNLQESMDVLTASGVPTAPMQMVGSQEELIKKATEMGYPLVGKIVSETITHKTDVKGIVTGIHTQEDLIKAWKELTAVTADEHMYMQKMLKGHELIVGAKRDHIFGPVVLVGLGGIYAELLKEAARFVYPFDLYQFKRALKHTKLNGLLKGFRGTKPIDIDALFMVADAIGSLFAHNPTISELDINPLMIVEGKPVAIDARIVLKNSV